MTFCPSCFPFSPPPFARRSFPPRRLSFFVERSCLREFFLDSFYPRSKALASFAQRGLLFSSFFWVFAVPGRHLFFFFPLSPFISSGPVLSQVALVVNLVIVIPCRRGLIFFSAPFPMGRVYFSDGDFSLHPTLFSLLHPVSDLPPPPGKVPLL